jgi:hypothetical protein
MMRYLAAKGMAGLARSWAKTFTRSPPPPANIIAKILSIGIKDLSYMPLTIKLGGILLSFNAPINHYNFNVNVVKCLLGVFVLEVAFFHMLNPY